MGRQDRCFYQNQALKKNVAACVKKIIGLFFLCPAANQPLPAGRLNPEWSVATGDDLGFKSWFTKIFIILALTCSR